MANDDVGARNRRTGLIVLSAVLGMLALSFAAVPMYRLFCQVTGIGGPAQAKIAAAAPTHIRDRQVEVRFNADVDARLPWSFAPEQRAVHVQVGAEGITAYRAENQSDMPLTGTAVYNVLPVKAARYFHKTQCFCFGEQHLAPGAGVDMPVFFYIDPAFADDPNMDDVRSVTLSYTFYRAESAELDAALTAFTEAQPLPVR